MPRTRRCSLSLFAVFFGVAILSGCGGQPANRGTDSGDEANASGQKASAPSTAPPKPRQPRAIDLRSLPQWET